MADSNKRKERPTGDGDKRGVKRSKGGTGKGKWQTPHQQEKATARGRGKIEPGDVGIFATCARGQERRATEELKSMFEECAERFYGIVSGPYDQADEDNGGSIDDIESSIRKEVSEQKSTPKLFSPVPLDLQCVLFFKTEAPLDPVDFVHRICDEIVSNQTARKMKYANRLTPMTLMGKATEKGLEELGRTVLGEHFKLEEETGGSGEGEAHESKTSKPAADYSYAIRPTIRNHSTLKRDVVIKQIASSIVSAHKVNLTEPEKIIICDIYQTVCGMSVVGSDWEKLKRFNLAELYQPSSKAAAVKAEAIPQSVTTDEGPPTAIS